MSKTTISATIDTDIAILVKLDESFKLSPFINECLKIYYASKLKETKEREELLQEIEDTTKKLMLLQSHKHRSDIELKQKQKIQYQKAIAIKNHGIGGFLDEE